MTPRICMCCGEPMAQRGHSLSRNPNLCASCSSLADGMSEPSMPRCKNQKLPSPLFPTNRRMPNPA